MSLPIHSYIKGSFVFSVFWRTSGVWLTQSNNTLQCKSLPFRYFNLNVNHCHVISISLTWTVVLRYWKNSMFLDCSYTSRQTRKFFRLKIFFQKLFGIVWKTFWRGENFSRHCGAKIFTSYLPDFFPEFFPRGEFASHATYWSPEGWGFRGGVQGDLRSPWPRGSGGRDCPRENFEN